MGQYKTYRNLYLENQVKDLQRQVINYKARDNYLYGKGAFGLIDTYKIYSATMTPGSGTYYIVTADLVFTGDSVRKGAHPYIAIEMYGTSGQRIEGDNNWAGSNRFDLPPYVNKAKISISAMSRYGTVNQPFYLIVKCYGNMAGAFELNITDGSLNGYV